MDLPPDKAETYAEILQILENRSSSIHMISIQTLQQRYLLSSPDDFVEECLIEMDSGDYPIRMTSSTVELTDREQARAIIVELRSDVYGSS